MSENGNKLKGAANHLLNMIAEYNVEEIENGKNISLTIRPQAVIAAAVCIAGCILIKRSAGKCRGKCK